MKLVKKANKNTIKISKNEWLGIGKKAGWMKKAELFGHNREMAAGQASECYSGIKSIIATVGGVNLILGMTPEQKKSIGTQWRVVREAQNGLVSLNAQAPVIQKFCNTVTDFWNSPPGEAMQAYGPVLIADGRQALAEALKFMDAAPMQPEPPSQPEI